MAVKNTLAPAAVNGRRHQHDRDGPGMHEPLEHVAGAEQPSILAPVRQQPVDDETNGEEGRGTGDCGRSSEERVGPLAEDPGVGGFARK